MIYITATNTAALEFVADAAFAGTIDNVSVNRITARTPAVGFPFAGTGNIGIGSGALANVVSGTYNFAAGQQALYSNTTGEHNNANGQQALFSNMTGSFNNANGYRALYSNTTGSYNNANGREALFRNTAGNHNNANGYLALFSNVNGSYNFAAGYQAGYFETASNLLIFAVSNTSMPPIRGIMSGATATMVFHSQHVSSNVLQIQGIASQSGALTRWLDSTGAVLAQVTANGSAQFVAVEIDGDLNHDGSNVGFYGTAPAAKGTVTGSRGGNAALESLLTALANIGLITDSSTA